MLQKRDGLRQAVESRAPRGEGAEGNHESDAELGLCERSGEIRAALY